MEVEGVIKLIGQEQSFGTNGFKKRDCVVTTDDQYPQMINVEFQQDKTSLLDSYQIGEKVKININLRGREWINPQGEAKYFNSIVGWRIERLQAGNAAANPHAASDAEANKINEEEPDDLPF